MNETEFEKRERARMDFVRHFLPEELQTGHELPYDFQSSCDHTPSIDELTRCFRAYLDLLKAVPRDQTCEVMSMCMMDASELSLAFLHRATRSDREMLVRDMAAQLLEEIDFLLTGVRQFNQQWVYFDACKRIRAISEVLKNPGHGDES